MRNKKGVTLIWALVMSTTILIIAASLADTIMKDSQGSIRVQDSSSAYVAAKSGIEVGKIRLETKKKTGNLGDENLPVINFVNGTKAIVTLKKGSDNQWTIGSTGYQGKVARYIENKMVSRTPKTVTFSNLSDLQDYAVSVTGSYSQKFSLYFPYNRPRPTRFDIGLANSATKGATDSSIKGVWAQYFDSNSNCTNTEKQSLNLIASNGSTTKSARICLADYGIDISEIEGVNYRLYVSIDYINDNIIQMSLKKYDFVNLTPVKTVSVVLDSSYAGISNSFSHIYSYFYPGAAEYLYPRDNGMTGLFTYSPTDPSTLLTVPMVKISAFQIID